MGRQKRPKKLTDKMLRLMSKLAEYNYLTITEVQLIFTNQTHSYRVLNRLKARGLTLDFRTGTSPGKAFCLSPEGYWTLDRLRRLPVTGRFKPEDFRPHIFQHRLACARLGLVLEEHPMVSWYVTEKPLWERRGWYGTKVCDAEFRFTNNLRGVSAQVGLEVELTLKNSDKLEESFRKLRERDDLMHVWWVCGSRGIRNALAREADSGPGDGPRHFFIGLEDALQSGHAWTLEDAQGTAYSIAPDSLEWPPRAKPLPPPEPTPEPAPPEHPPPAPVEPTAPEPVRQEPRRTPLWDPYRRPRRRGLFRRRFWWRRGVSRAAETLFAMAAGGLIMLATWGYTDWSVRGQSKNGTRAVARAKVMTDYVVKNLALMPIWVILTVATRLVVEDWKEAYDARNPVPRF
ncbi:MAG: hypothetical protein ABII00_06225 [Elusimicrobiota bacterium]